jgi:ribonuclease P protein component
MRYPQMELTMRRAPGSNDALFRAAEDGAAQSARQRPAPPRAVVAAGKRLGLDRGRRLRQKAQFEGLLRQGVRRTLDGYTFYLMRRETGGPRLGMLVSRRHASRAVERNRIKRCIREAFRLEQERMGPLDVLVRPPYGARPSARMILRLRDIFGRLKP